MSAVHPTTFGELLRRYRVAAELTQEELAERANLSARAISDLERGVKRIPRRDTIQLLAEALELSAEDQARLEAVVVRHRSGGADQATPARQPPPSLPVQSTPFVGRTSEIAAVCDLLRRPEVRLLTLTGPGGTGKTRLALQAATEVLKDFADGIFFVPLEAVPDPKLLTSTIARSLGVQESGKGTLLESLKAYIGERNLLLLLDNFEQVVEAAPLVAEFLAACPRLKVLITSRSLLHLSAENGFPVRPLAVPDPDEQPALEAFSHYDAVALFVQRAQAAKPDFAVTDENARAVAGICYRLDGLPLAIELAAARIRLLPAQAMLARLEQVGAGEVLTGGPIDVPARQQTLRATIDWSYSLLDEEEQRLLARLAIFVGGCTLDAVESVCSLDAGATDALGGMASLMDKSLLWQSEREAGEPRFMMLETIREYALRRLEASGEAEELGRRHAQYYLGLAERAESALTGAQQGEWLKRLEAEHNNLLAALSWSSKGGQAETGLRLSGALWRFWDIRGYWIEGRRWLEEALGAGQTVEAPVRAKALNAAGNVTWRLGDYEAAASLYGECLALCRKLKDDRGVATSLSSLGIVAAIRGEYQQATTFQEESVALCRTLGDTRGTARALNNLGILAANQGQYERAATLYEESLALKRRLGDRLGVAGTLGNLGFVVQQQGDFQRAAALYEESLDVFRDLGDRRGIGRSLADLGKIALARREYDRARALIRESLEWFRKAVHALGMVECVEILAQLATAEGRAEQAAMLFGAAESSRAASGAPLPPVDRATNERSVEDARALLDEERWTAAWEQGRAMSLEHAITRGLQEPAVPLP